MSHINPAYEDATECEFIYPGQGKKPGLYRIFNGKWYEVIDDKPEPKFPSINMEQLEKWIKK